MGKLPITIILASAVLFGSDLRIQFEALKREGRAAVAAEDWATAEARYSKLLQISDAVNPATYEMYADVVTPLADVYRKSDQPEKLEALYRMRVERAAPGLAKGLAEADLGFFYQGSDFASSDQLHGERMIDNAVKTFEHCSSGKTESSKTEADHCRRRLVDTAGIQGAMYFQRQDYKRAEPLFRRVIASPESIVQEEVMLVSLHALRGILILRKDLEGARQLEVRASAFEAAHPNALDRLKNEGTRARSR